MSFRMKAKDTGDPDFLDKEAKYRSHLAGFKKDDNPDLWSYFGSDFFHNGPVHKISLEKGLNCILLEMNCPNIKHFKNDKDFELIDVDFLCYFHDVVYFSMESCDSPAKAGEFFYGYEDFTYLSSEINSLEDRIAQYAKAYPEKLYSLVIQLLADSGKGYINIVFNRLDVFPKEPLAFQLLSTDKNYEIPLFKDKSPTPWG